MTYLITGLGNIGEEYHNTRHNIGFTVLDFFAEKQSLKFGKSRLGQSIQHTINGRKIILLKPDTYVNLSGEAVFFWINYYKIPIENLLIILDDLSIPFGTIRLKEKGGNAGHNGLKSIESALATQNYARLRFGIGADFPRGRQVDFVLGKFSENEKKQIPLLLDKTKDILMSFVMNGVQTTMNRFN